MNKIFHSESVSQLQCHLARNGYIVLAFLVEVVIHSLTNVSKKSKSRFVRLVNTSIFSITSPDTSYAPTATALINS